MILYYSVMVLHVLVCLILILVVLLQSGKGADLAGAFGGGATQTAFGSRGPASFLSKLTTVSAILFMATCLTLSLLDNTAESESILDKTKGTSAPAPKAPAVPVQPEAPPPTPEQIKKMQEEIEQKQKQSQAGTKGSTEGTASPSPKPADSKPPAKETKPPDESKKP